MPKEAENRYSFFSGRGEALINFEPAIAAVLLITALVAYEEKDMNSGDAFLILSVVLSGLYNLKHTPHPFRRQKSS